MKQSCKPPSRYSAGLIKFALSGLLAFYVVSTLALLPGAVTLSDIEEEKSRFHTPEGEPFIGAAMSDQLAKPDKSEAAQSTPADTAAASAASAFHSELHNTTIILMRHAEKPSDPDDPDLAPAGFARANALAAYIPEHFGRTPDYLFASKDSNSSSRPRETLEPLSEKIGVPIDTSIKDKNYADLAQELNDPRFDGKFIAVAWHHGKIPELAQALGAPAGSYPAKWDSSVFNQILEFDFDKNGNESVKTITEDFANPKQ